MPCPRTQSSAARETGVIGNNFQIILYFSLQVSFVLVNSVDPDEKLH